MVSNTSKKDDKFSANWEGPFKVQEDVKGRTYRLEQLSGESIPNTWNVTDLKFYFS